MRASLVLVVVVFAAAISWRLRGANCGKSDDDNFSDDDDFSDYVDRKVKEWKLGERLALRDDFKLWKNVFSKVNACCGLSKECIKARKKLGLYQKKRGKAIEEFLKQNHREKSLAEFQESLKELHKAFEEDEKTYAMNKTAQLVEDCCKDIMGVEVAEEYANELKMITFDRRKVLEQNQIWEYSKLRGEKMSIYNDLDGPC